MIGYFHYPAMSQYLRVDMRTLPIYPDNLKAYKASVFDERGAFQASMHFVPELVADRVKRVMVKEMPPQTYQNILRWSWK